MRNKVLYVCFGFALIFSCQKFKHDEIETNECTKCEWAEQLEGTYRGWSSGPEDFFGGINMPMYNGDSLEVLVEHIFLNEGADIDSNLMFFRFSGKLMSHQDYYRVDTFAIENSETGNIVNSHLSEFYLKDGVLRCFGMFNSSYLRTDYTGYKL